MRSFRFSIARLMWVVLLAAIASAGLAYPSTHWAGIVVLLTRGVLCLALVGSVCRTGAKRAWWLGFFAFGWAYLGVSHADAWSPNPTLPTDALLNVLARLIGVSPTGVRLPPRQEAMAIMFSAIGQSFWVLAAAVIGGFLARAAAQILDHVWLR